MNDKPSTEVSEWMREAAREGYQLFNDWLRTLLNMKPVFRAEELPVKFAEIIARHMASAPQASGADERRDVTKSARIGDTERREFEAWWDDFYCGDRNRHEAA